MVKVAAAVVFLLSRNSTYALFAEKVPDVPLHPCRIQRAFFFFRQHFRYVVLPACVCKQQYLQFIQWFQIVLPRVLVGYNIFICFFVFYIRMGKLHGQLAGQPGCQWREQLCGMWFGQRIHGRVTDAAACPELYQPPFHEMLACLADVLLGRRQPYADDCRMAGERHVPSQAVRLVQEIVIQCHLRGIERTAIRFCPETVDVFVDACHDLPFGSVEDILLRLTVEFLL